MKKKLVKWAYVPLNKKIAIIFLIITILTSSVVGLVSYQLSKKIITSSSIEKSQNAIQAVTASVNTFIDSNDKTFISIYSNHKLRQYLGRKKIASTEKAHQTIQSAVTLARQLNNSVVYINIYGINGYEFTDYYYYSEKNKDYDSCVSYYYNYGLTPERKSALWIPNQSANIGYSNRRLLTLVRYTRDFYTLEITGILAMGITESSLCKQYQSLNSNIFITDSDGLIISHYDKSLIGTKIPYPSLDESLHSNCNIGTISFINKNNTKLFATYSIIPATGWYLVSIEDYYETFKSSYNLKYSIYIILLITIILSSLILFSVSKALTSSLNRLFSTMQHAMSGDLSVRYVVSGNDDVNNIGFYLNEMLSQINENISYREKSERLARISDLRLLQSQINPHLLYNTLDSVHYHLETAKYKQASDILQAMSAFFKLSLSQGDFLIPIERELSLIKSYLDIQRMCREKDIELVITCDSTFLNIKIPKMIIQPIVENSLIHGFEGDNSHGKISIDFQKRNDTTVLIKITDNGIGMTYKQTDEINADINSSHSGFEQKHYGLWNINQRLKDAFGKNSGLIIQSEFGDFTKAIIIINRESYQDHEQKKGFDV